jgi:transposase
MASSPKKYSSDFKAKVALEAIKRQKTINEISSEYGVHSTQITQVARSKFSMNFQRSSHDQDLNEQRMKNR